MLMAPLGNAPLVLVLVPLEELFDEIHFERR